MTINAALFAEAGGALFGSEWKQALADLIGMDVRRVRRIAKAAREGADYPVHESLGPILSGHLKDRARTAKAEAKEAERLAALLDGSPPPYGACRAMEGRNLSPPRSKSSRGAQRLVR